MDHSLKTTTAEIDAQIGARLRSFRAALGLSQTELADALGVTFQQLQKYEKGTNRISASALVLLCKRLGISPLEIIGSYFDGTETEATGLASKVVDLEDKLSQIKKLAA